MKKFISFPFCFVLLFSSCKKSASPMAAANGSSLTANVNGAPVTFNFLPSGSVTEGNPGGLWYIDISGNTDTSRHAANLQIYLDSSHNPFSTGLYNIGGGKGFMSYTDAYGNEYQNDSTSTTNLPQLVITSSTSTGATANIQGTFSGTLKAVNSGTQPETTTISNGKFNIYYQP